MCLENVISVKNNCSDVTPSSGIYLNTFLPGMSIQEIGAGINAEQESAYQFIQDQITNAGLLINSEIRSKFAHKFKGTSVIANAVTGYFQDNQNLVTSQPTYLVGKQFEVDEYPFMELFISKVGLQINYTGTKSVFVYDLIQNKLLDTISVTCVAGQISYADVYKTYPSNGQKLNLFVCWLADQDYYRTDLTTGGDCSSCSGHTYSNRYLSISVSKVLSASAKLDQNTSSLDYDGLTVSYSLSCSFEPFICSIKNSLAIALAYKTGALIMEQMRYSKRNNSIISVFGGDYSELAQLYSDKYQFEMEEILKNMRLPNDICFECKKRGGFVTNLP